MKKDLNEIFKLATLSSKCQKSDKLHAPYFVVNYTGKYSDQPYSCTVDSFLGGSGADYEWERNLKKGLIKSIEIKRTVNNEVEVLEEITFTRFKRILKQIRSLKKEVQRGSELLSRIYEITKINLININDFSAIHEPRKLNHHDQNTVGGQLVVDDLPISIYGYFKDLSQNGLYKTPGIIRTHMTEKGAEAKLNKPDIAWTSSVIDDIEKIDKEIMGLKSKEFVLTPLKNDKILLTKINRVSNKGNPSFVISSEEKSYDFNNLAKIFRNWGYEVASSKDTESIYFGNGEYRARISNHGKSAIECDPETQERTLTIRFDKEESSFALINKILTWTQIRNPQGVEIQKRINF